MTSMAYCRFRNTLIELRSCYEAMAEMNNPHAELSAEEYEAYVSLIDLCADIAEDSP